MILSAAASLYASATRLRRRWYASPSRRHRLSRPVVSVGNLRAGGSGKTPIVEHLARVLLLCGERPAILSRGYARPSPSAGVTVVSDPTHVLATYETAGDEPLMLARALPGVPVLVSADRFAAGQLAEERFGTTVHLLDDGFQHLTLARDADLLAVSPVDLAERMLPAGHLREPLDAAAAADALLISNGNSAAQETLTRGLGVSTAFQVRRTLGEPRCLRSGERAVVPSGQQVFAFAGIARPERFFRDIETAGWRLAGTLTFADHHPFTRDDVQQVLKRVRETGAAVAMTTEKDGVRLAGPLPSDSSIVAVPLSVSVEPADTFRQWLLARIGRA